MPGKICWPNRKLAANGRDAHNCSASRRPLRETPCVPSRNGCFRFWRCSRFSASMLACGVYPIAETLRLSLFKWNIISRRKPFIGLDNFVELIERSAVSRSDLQHHHRRLRRPGDHHSRRAGARRADQQPARAAAQRLLRNLDLPAARRVAGAGGDGLEMDLRCAARAAQRPALDGSASRPSAWLFDPTLVAGVHDRAVLLAVARLRRPDLSGRIEEPCRESLYEAARLDGASAFAGVPATSQSRC